MQRGERVTEKKKKGKKQNIKSSQNQKEVLGKTADQQCKLAE